ncbi:hypothetical protein NSE_0354 [Neorickettsia sennetsu str. Miyayama]|uniref:Uncharacterized protein n=1 Tax=Ehrlichia sennetsu (strain ATCC VR-367 / Miyayama) TaxID=222891 RepID=Q2GE53_EHRS3|nr:hypothetical protein NSE_0354 [Neorickettsia sennetsu str. Miyayama]
MAKYCKIEIHVGVSREIKMRWSSAANKRTNAPTKNRPSAFSKHEKAHHHFTGKCGI